MDLRKELEGKLTAQSNKYSDAVKKIRELTATRKKATTDADIKKINDQIATFQKTADASMREYNKLVKLRKDAKSYDSLSKQIKEKEQDLAKAEARGENVDTLNAALIKARNDRSNLVPNLGNLVPRTQTTVQQETETLNKPSTSVTANKPATQTLKPPVTTGGTTGGGTTSGGTAGGTTDGGTTTPTVTGPLTTPGKATGGVQGPGVGVRDALKIPGRAEPAFQELIDKAEFNFGLPDYIFTVDRDKKTGELGQLGKLLLKAVEQGYSEKKFLDEAMLTDWWQSNSGSVRERIIGLNKYKELQKKGLDVSKTDFGMYQTDKMRQVKDRAKKLAGVTLDDATAQKIVEDIYNGFLDNDPLAIDRLIIPYVSKTTNLYGKGAVTGFGGEALQVQQSLAAIAKANGLAISDILPKLGGGVLGKDAEQTAIQEVLSGNIDLNTILSNARQIAAQGQPEYVRKLLGSGYDLEDIYAPYKKTMASVLELDPEQIDLNDNSLRMAINEKGDMNIYDYKKALRQDDRWQYTGQAKESVSNIALKVLQDFGFQG